MSAALAEFLLARIAEDEDLALLAQQVERGQPPPSLQGSLAALKNIVRHDPARVLAECKAKRNLIDRSTPPHVLRTLAAIYSDHPDYREEWR